MVLFVLDENTIVSDVRVLRDNRNFHSVVNVCMSTDESRLIGLVTTINSIVKNSKHPSVKFHILVTSAAYDILMLVSVILFEYSDPIRDI